MDETIDLYEEIEEDEIELEEEPAIFGTFPTGTIDITENGTHNVKEYEYANVQTTPNLQNKTATITENTTTEITADTGYDGMGKVTITTNVAPNLQDKSVSITENGTTILSADTGFDGLDNVEINVNLSGAYKVPNGVKFYGSSVFPPNLDTSEVTDMKEMFARCTFSTMGLIDTSNVTTMQAAFSLASNLVTIPLLDTSSIYVKNNVNQYGINDIFTGCTSLSNESLNNILAMCVNMTVVTTNMRTLRRIGLTSTQAATCQTLSNWQDFLNAGWTTGY